MVTSLELRGGGGQVVVRSGGGGGENMALDHQGVFLI